MGNQHAQKALKKLFALGDKLAQGERSSSLLLNNRSFPDYNKIKDAEVKISMHGALENAERFGAIKIDWVRGYEGTQVERLRLLDVALLASFLGVKTLISRINDAKDFLSPYENTFPEWLRDYYSHVFEAWKNGRKPCGFTPEHTDAMRDLGLLIIYLEEGKNELDMRTVSVRLFKDSKYIENTLLGKLVSIYKAHLNKVYATEEEILAEISLAKYAWPVFLSGSIKVISNEGDSLSCSIKPYVGVPPDAIHSIKVIGDVRYILSIENFSSFNTYTRRISDGGIIIYTNGFPNKSLASFYKDLLFEVDSKVPVYHWGDIDVGGFRILAKMQEYASTYKMIVHPHLMSPLESHEGALFTQSQISDLLKIDTINSDCSKIISALKSGLFPKVEQESVLAVSPLKKL